MHAVNSRAGLSVFASFLLIYQPSIVLGMQPVCKHVCTCESSVSEYAARKSFRDFFAKIHGLWPQGQLLLWRIFFAAPAQQILDKISRKTGLWQTVALDRPERKRRRALAGFFCGRLPTFVVKTNTTYNNCSKIPRRTSEAF